MRVCANSQMTRIAWSTWVVNYRACEKNSHVGQERKINEKLCEVKLFKLKFAG
jgi:hypothetical protein